MNNQPAPLTLARLIELNVCAPQVKLFKATFGESVDMANPPESYETLAFNWVWASHNLLDVAALTAYNKATDVAWAKRDKATDAPWAERNKIIAAAKAEYDKAAAPAEADFNKARADAFVDGYVETYWRKNNC